MAYTYKQAEHFATRAEVRGDWTEAEEFWRIAAESDTPPFLTTRFLAYSAVCHRKAIAGP